MRRQLIRALATTAVVTAGALPVTAALGAAGPVIRTDRGCYLVGQKVKVAGSGFAASRAFDVAVDGIDFGQSTTNVAGAFSSSLIPGGLGLTEASMAGALRALSGISTSSAVAVTILTRVATFWVAVLLGLCAFASWQSIRRRRESKTSLA